MRRFRRVRSESGPGGVRVGRLRTVRSGPGGLWAGRFGRLRSAPERGDVPGWVLIAVMTAALVLAILVPFRDAVIPAMTAAVEDVFTQADR